MSCGLSIFYRLSWRLYHVIFVAFIDLRNTRCWSNTVHYENEISSQSSDEMFNGPLRKHASFSTRRLSHFNKFAEWKRCISPWEMFLGWRSHQSIGQFLLCRRLFAWWCCCTGAGKLTRVSVCLGGLEQDWLHHGVDQHESSCEITATFHWNSQGEKCHHLERDSRRWVERVDRDREIDRILSRNRIRSERVEDEKSLLVWFQTHIEEERWGQTTCDIIVETSSTLWTTGEMLNRTPSHCAIWHETYVSVAKIGILLDLNVVSLS